MTPPKHQDTKIPCESSFCLVPALKESIDRAEGFNQEYRIGVKETLEGIKNSTDKMATFLEKQAALKDRVDGHDVDINKIFDILRVEVIPILGKKVSRGEVISYALAAIAISSLIVTLVK